MGMRVPPGGAAKTSARRWLVMLLAAVFAMGGLLHTGPLHVESFHGAELPVAMAWHGGGMPGSHVLGNRTLGNHLLGQLHDTPFGNCVASGICSLCGMTSVKAPTTSKTCPHEAPPLAVAMISLTIPPPLRPPTLRG
jgi:hypothetical protein